MWKISRRTAMFGRRVLTADVDAGHGISLFGLVTCEECVVGHSDRTIRLLTECRYQWKNLFQTCAARHVHSKTVEVA